MFDYEIRWLKAAKAAGFTIPSTYITFDLETTGLKPHRVFITQAGHLSVTAGIPGEPFSTLLGWPKTNAINQADFREQLIEVENDYLSRNDRYRFSYDLLNRDGADPLRIVELYHDTFVAHQAQGGSFATHNGAKFDTQVWQSHFRKYLDSDFCFNLERMHDTGLVEKAIGLSRRRFEQGKSEWLPHPDESRAWFYHRTINEYGHKLGWGLGDTIKKYGLDRAFNLDLDNSHTAGFDCTMTHLLVEKHRQLMEC
jgi:hypothetical protein